MKVVKNLVSALEIIHEAGYCYNDLKLDNVMIELRKNKEPRTVLIDYGMATRFIDKKTGEHLEMT